MTVHVAGAGLAGLAAAWAAARAGHRVVVHEAAGQAGGRCRAVEDSGLGRMLDNGTHVVLGANRTALDFLVGVGGPGAVRPAAARSLPFLDLGTSGRWDVDVTGNALRTLVRAGGTRALARTLRAGLGSRRGGTVAEAYGALGAAYARLVAPLALAVLNRRPEETPAAVLTPVLKRLALGGRGVLRPHVANRDIGRGWIGPAVDTLVALGAEIRFHDALRGIDASGGRLRSLRFRTRNVVLADADALILALPPWSLGMLRGAVALPPYGSASIVSAHFLAPELGPLPGGGTLMGLTGGLAQWIARRGAVLSLTVSAAGDLVGLDSGEIARLLWREAAAALGAPEDGLPPYRVIKERRATAHLARPFGPKCGIANLFFAGGWTGAPLPDTIETAVTSGIRAAGRIAEPV